MSTGLYAVQHIRRMRGGSQAQLLRASDGAYYVTKFQNNPQHIRVLANEMLASRLAQWLGLPAPRVEVIEVSDWLIAHTQDLRVELGTSTVPCSSGRQLASLYPDLEEQVFDYVPENMLSRVSNLRDFARCLVLDKWTGNSDGRQTIFIRRPRGRRYKAAFIDQGYCFNAGEWTFPDSALRGAYARNSVYAAVTGWDYFEPALTRAEGAEPLDLWRCAEPIPPEWYEYDHDGMARLVESLYERRRIIRDLISAFRKSSRNPFPNWRDRTVSLPVSALPPDN
ncbi:MAG: HipA family kinase [Candidatus Angelobacter sp.]